MQLSLVARYRGPGDETFREDRTSDVSAGGMFIATVDPAPRSTLLKIECATGHPRTAVNAIARVAWTRREPSDDRPPGMGLKFVRIDDRSSRMLVRLMREARAASTPPAASPTARKRPSKPVLVPAPIPKQAPTPEVPPAAAAPPAADTKAPAADTKQAPIAAATPTAKQAPIADTEQAPIADTEQAPVAAEAPAAEPPRTQPRSGSLALVALAAVAAVAGLLALRQPTPATPIAPKPVPVPAPVPEPVPAPVPAPVPEPIAAPKPVPVPAPAPVPEPIAAPKPVPVPAPAPVPAPIAAPTPVPAPAPAPVPAPIAAPTPEPATETAPAAVHDEYRLRVITTPPGATVTLREKQQFAPFNVTLTPAQLAQPIEVYAELEGHRPTKAHVSIDNFELVKGIMRETLYLKLRPRE